MATLKKVFKGQWPQVVTELKKVFDPGETYELTDAEVDLLSKRDFFKLFEEPEKKAKEKPKAEEKSEEANV
jgi:hypothetical protein